MDPKPVGSELDSKQAVNYNEDKKLAIEEELKKMNKLPPNSSYASHRLRVLNKILHLLSLQVRLSVT